MAPTLPRGANLSLPGIANLWLTLLKETSLVSIIALDDLMRESYIAVGRTKQPFLFFGIALQGGFALMRWLQRHLGQRATRDEPGI